jgi:anaerobic carbon-monoxide dehydrogenase iron sulfur subunit
MHLSSKDQAGGLKMPLHFKPSLCTGCKLCQLACSATHDKVFNPEKSRIKIIHEYKSDGIHIKSRHCIFCKECESACPEEAISNNGRWMIVNHEKCTGCGTCVEACPTKIIYLDNDEKSIICDLCGGKPKCIEWCPKGVIGFRNIEAKKEEAIA